MEMQHADAMNQILPTWLQYIGPFSGNLLTGRWRCMFRDGGQVVAQIGSITSCPFSSFSF
jgi:hypothetical protein